MVSHPRQLIMVETRLAASPIAPDQSRANGDAASRVSTRERCENNEGADRSAPKLPITNYKFLLHGQVEGCGMLRLRLGRLGYGYGDQRRSGRCGRLDIDRRIRRLGR